MSFYTITLLRGALEVSEEAHGPSYILGELRAYFGYRRLLCFYQKTSTDSMEWIDQILLLYHQSFCLQNTNQSLLHVCIEPIG